MFSIVIPLYNKANSISETLQSVLNQTYTDFEIIIVNDGSTDNSLEMVRQFKDERIRIFSKSNGGVSSARNFGIKQAKGKYIALLDADDLWKPDFLFEMHKLITKYPNCGIYASGHIHRDKKDTIYASDKEGIIENYFQRYWEKKYPFCHSSCVVIPTAVFLETGYFQEDMAAGEDTYMWIKIAAKYKVCVTPKILEIHQMEFSSYKTWSNIKKNLSNNSCIDLYTPDNFYLNEVLAYWGIAEGINQRLINNTKYSIKCEKDYSYTKLNKKSYYFLYLLNRLPNSIVYIIKRTWSMLSILKHKLL